MNGHSYTSFYVVSLAVLSISAADVFIINVKPSERSPLSVSIDRSLHTLQELLGKKPDKETTRVELLSSSVQKSVKDGKEIFIIGPAPSSDITKTNVADLLRLVDAIDVTKTSNQIPIDVQYRLFGNMYGTPKKPSGYAYKKPKRSIGLDSKILQPFLKYLISNTVPKLRHKFKDLTRFDPSNIAEDYIDLEELSRDKQIDRYSDDYIDLDSMKFRRSDDYTINAAVTTHSAESNDESNLSVFETIKNKLLLIFHNIMQNFNTNDNETISTVDNRREVENKKKILNDRFNMKNKKNKISVDIAGSSISFETVSGAKGSISQTSKKKRHKPAKKKHKHVSKKNKPIEFYMQGNRMTMYPRMNPNSLEENNSHDNRRREERLPEQYHWNMEEGYSL